MITFNNGELLNLKSKFIPQRNSQLLSSAIDWFSLTFAKAHFFLFLFLGCWAPCCWAFSSIEGLDSIFNSVYEGDFSALLAGSFFCSVFFATYYFFGAYYFLGASTFFGASYFLAGSVFFGASSFFWSFFGAYSFFCSFLGTSSFLGAWSSYYFGFGDLFLFLPPFWSSFLLAVFWTTGAGISY